MSMTIYKPGWSESLHIKHIAGLGYGSCVGQIKGPLKHVLQHTNISVVIQLKLLLCKAGTQSIHFDCY